MYFDFDDRHPDYDSLRSGMGRGGIVVPWWVVWAWFSIMLHVVFVLMAIFLPEWVAVLMPARADAARQAALAKQQQPRAEFEAKRIPQTPDLSDRDRSMMTPFKPPDPKNDLPFSRGNTPERIDQPGTEAPPKPQPDAPPSPPDTPASREAGSPAPGSPGQAQADDSLLRGLTGPAPKPPSGNNGTGTGGALSNALRDVTRYAPAQIFDNSQGGGQFGSADVTVIGPCPVDAFNNSSYNAIAASNPTQPLPPEYPADKAFFTVTFFYNEQPPR
jgi:hypothetical protein